MRSRRPATRRSSDGDQDNEDSFNLDTDENPDDERRGSPAPVGITAGYSLADGSGGSTTATGASTTAAKLGADDNGPPTEPPTQPGPATPSSDAQNAAIRGHWGPPRCQYRRSSVGASRPTSRWPLAARSRGQLSRFALPAPWTLSPCRAFCPFIRAPYSLPR